MLVEERVDRLEALFGQFMAQTGAALLRIDRTIERMERAAEQERQDWNRRFERMDQAAEQERQDWNHRFEQRDQAAEQERQDWNRRFERIERAAEKDKQEWNRRWGELANRLGTIVEDIVAPSIPRIALTDFGWSEIQDLAVRRTVRNKTDRSKRREFDVIAVGDSQVIVVETKATPRIEYVDAFIGVLGEFKDYFPEYADKIIVPIFASLNLDEGMVNYLTQHRVYALAMGSETMELVNFAVLGNPSTV